MTKSKTAPETSPGGDALGLTHVDPLKKLRIVFRAAQRHSARIEKQCGVTGAQLWVMRELYETPGLRVGEIADKLALHQATASNLLDALVKKGYVQKRRDSQDQRVVRLMLSDSGLALIGRAPAGARGLLPEALRKLDQASLAQLDAGLRALMEVIGQVDESNGMQPLPFTM